jgi:alkaline phosphatase
VLLGGGRCAFIPQSEEDSCRYDDYNLIKIGQEKYGWNYVDSVEGLKSASELVSRITICGTAMELTEE